MAQQFLSGFEREPQYEESLCQQCTQPITNPICHNCLSEGMIKWLAFYPSVRKKIAPKIKKYVQEINNSANHAVNCVSCNKRKAALCPYCFSSGIFQLLKRNKVDRSVVGDFLTVFNFDMEHEGYIQNAIEEGFY
jgi:TPP-dependent indolepyruvate ferredoxin oxidoreductase alpha subunit